MRILVLRGGALGDFLVTLPALGLLRARWPAARIELVGNARAGELGILGGYLDAVHAQDESRWGALYADAPLPEALTAFLTEFDWVISFWPDPDQSLRRKFPTRPGQQVLLASAAVETAPAARHFCAALAPLGIATSDFRSRLSLPRSRRAQAIARPIAVHPGSGSPRKNWRLDRWLQLIPALAPPVVVVLGAAELGVWTTDIRRRLAAGVSDLTFAIEPALGELAAILANARLFVGHDSGVSHLAAAVGTPALLLFGPSDPAVWAPPGDRVRVIHRGASLDAIAVDEVRATVESLLRGSASAGSGHSVRRAPSDHPIRSATE